MTIFKKMRFSKIFPTKYFAVGFFEILEACCNLKQGSLVMSLPFFFWGVLDMGGQCIEMKRFYGYCDCIFEGSAIWCLIPMINKI